MAGFLFDNGVDADNGVRTVMTVCGYPDENYDNRDAVGGLVTEPLYLFQCAWETAPGSGQYEIGDGTGVFRSEVAGWFGATERVLS